MEQSRRTILKGLALAPLAARQTPASSGSGFIYESAPFPSCHASTIVEIDKDRFLAAWFGGREEGATDVAIWMSSRAGSTWSAPVKVAEEPGVPCWNPVLYRNRDGEILLFYKAGTTPQTWSGLIRRSRDSGKRWSEPELLPSGIFGPIKNKPISGRSGELICGSSSESYKAWTCWVEITRDGGSTWSKHGPIFVPGQQRGIIQPALWRARDGKLRMLVRATQNIGFICMAESGDEGRTWSAARPTSLPNPNSGLDAVGLKDGRVLVVYNHTTRGRTPLNVGLSSDDGLTWTPGPILEDQPGEYSYPAVIQASGGEVHITYTWKRQRIKHRVISV